MWNGNELVFRTYCAGNEKKPVTKVKGVKHIMDFEEASEYKSFGALLNTNIVDISFDTYELSEKFWKMSEKNKWNCLILENPSNGHIHSFWKDTKKKIKSSGVDTKLAVGLIADIHKGDTYIPLRVDGVDRFPPSFEPEKLDEVPAELLPVKTGIELLNMNDGDGRNEQLFKYILILQTQVTRDKNAIKRILRNTNEFIFSKPVSREELNNITRDEAFSKPTFQKDNKFLHSEFALYMKEKYHVIRIQGQLHVYDEGVYKSGYKFLENKMIEAIPTLKAVQRTETLKYLEIITPEETAVSDANYIAFNNGVYDLSTDTLLPFSSDYVITNKIPWDFNETAYSEIADKTLDKISCYDKEIRAILEECIGYCFFRQNELSKSFMLTGTGSNGKSTYLDMIENVLGRQNYVALELSELSERFSVATMFGKLACIGDDISDEFLQGRSISQFKKIVSGNDIKAENKGQDVFFFKPTVKLLFSTNEIPRMRNKGFDAIKRRLVIIPFNAKFSKDDEDFDSGITWKLKKQDVAEYLIQLGIKGLKRVLENQDFTESRKVAVELEQFEKDNNPVLLFLNEVEESEILNNSTKEVFSKYDIFCYESGFTKMTRQTFSKEICRILNCTTRLKTINKERIRVFERQ